LSFPRWQENQWPEIYARNQDRLFPQLGDAPERIKRKNSKPGKQSLQEVIENARRKEQPSQVEGHEINPGTTHEIFQEAELELAKRELKELEAKAKYVQNKMLQNLVMMCMVLEWRQALQQKRYLILL